MITVAEAKNRVLLKCNALSAVEMPIALAVGYVLAADIFSSIDIPCFRQSSMDGFAIRFSELHEQLTIQDELPAGSPKQIVLTQGSAIKVYTGGPIPESADTVVQKEWVLEKGDTISIDSTKIAIGAHIRLPGTEIKKGVLAMPAGMLITFMHIGYLASLGITTVSVIRKPSVAIVITGNEVVAPGEKLLSAQVYESNSFTLGACLQHAGILQVQISYAKDDLSETGEKIKQALVQSDIVLITGGVSVGAYDYVAAACENLSIQKQFHGVQQKPGKPLLFGTFNTKLVFGLPGNPASVLSCFQQYVLPAIHVLTAKPIPVAISAQLREGYEKKSNLCFFLKGFVVDGMVTILQAQESFQLSAFVQANCWVELAAQTHIFKPFEQVKVHMFA